MKRTILVTLILAAVVLAATRVYDIEPYKNCNGKAREIGQTFVATCDSFIWAEIFIGAANNVGQYNFRIEEYETSTLIAIGDTNARPTIHYQYVRAYLEHYPNARVIKGKQYLLKITHSNNDTINYYYDSRNKYKYGYIVVGGLDEPGLKDLAPRIEGINASC